jgi:hypothetical protein
MARVYGNLGMTAAEIEEGLEDGGWEFVEKLHARARGVAR